MLSRTADHLYWMNRYTERAENTARMLNVNYETSLLPQSAEVAQAGWQGLLSISELLPSYEALYGEVTAAGVMAFMVKDADNPSSIISCLRAARENARAVRGTLTTEVWETQNQTRLAVNRKPEVGGGARAGPGGPPQPAGALTHPLAGRKEHDPRGLAIRGNGRLRIG